MTRLLAGGIVAGFLGLFLAPAGASERSQAFVDELRKREFFDTTLDYLDSMRTSPLAGSGFQEVIDFEIGRTLVASARALPLVDREKRLNEARNAFQKFIVAHPTHWLAIEARAHLANLLVERGRVKIELGVRFKREPEEKAKLATEARALYQDAQKLFATIDVELAEKLKDYKTIESNDVPRLRERDQLRTDIMQARLALASVIYEIARTYEPGSRENKENLQAAAAKYEEFYLKYKKWVGGYYARVDEARCYQELGDAAKAMVILNEVMAKQEFDEGFHRVRNAATLLALQTAMLPQVKQYKEAIEIYRNWEKNIAQRGESTEDALAIKCLSGEAALEYARSVKVDSLEAVKQRSDLLQAAKDLLTFTTRFPGEHRRRARVKLSDPLLGGGRSSDETAKNFGEARDRARIAWDRLRESDLKPDEEKQLRAEALRNYRYALAHAPRDTSVEELNVIRYYLAYLYWLDEQYYDAAILGEFLARRYPNRPEAQQAAKLTLASYVKLLDGAPPDGDRNLEKERMMSIAQFITERWPNSPAADEAWMMLIRTAVNDRNLGKTVEYLNHVSADSPRRGETELLTGQTLWTAYLDAMRLPEDKRPAKNVMTDMFAQSRKALEDGVNRLRKPVDAGGQMSTPLAAAVLSLAQICLESGEASKAVAWLDDPNIGPHTLVKVDHRLTHRGNYRVETLKATLRAYVAARQLEDINGTMEALEKAGGDIDLTQIYLSLGRQLDASFQQIRAEGKREEAAKIVPGFVSLLSRLAARPVKETNFNTLNWTAETFADLGANIDADNGKPAPEAVVFYQKATDVYGTILEACRTDRQFAPRSEAVMGVRIRLARCLRRLGKYSQAIDALVEVLKEQGDFLVAQREAAYTYQAWGEKKPEAYRRAIVGGPAVELKDGRTVRLVWGWGGIARRTQSVDSLTDLYHEARYNLAICRFNHAMSALGQERTDLLNQAQRDILVIYRLYPEMGGKKWYDQYDVLLRKIQRLLGVRVEGLMPFQEQKLSNTTTSTSEKPRE